MDEYAPPKHVMREWLRQCICCQECSDAPCDGVMAGGLCEELCNCDDDDYDEDQICYYCGQDSCDCDML